MELETLEVLLDVNTAKVEESLERFMPQIENMMSRLEQISSKAMGRTEKNMDIEKGASNFTKQIEKMNQHFEKTMANLEKTSKVSGDNVGNNFASGVRKARPKATKEIDQMVNEINAKMRQANAAQERAAFLKSQRQSSSKDGNTGKVVRYDEQIARAQAQMTKYEGEARKIAGSIKAEFDSIPSALEGIDRQLDSNTAKMRTHRQKINQLKAQYQEQLAMKGNFSEGFTKVDTDKSLETKGKISVVSANIKDLVSQNRNLETQYGKTEARAEALRKAIARVNNTMSQSSIQTGSAANGAAQTGSGLKQSERAVSKYGGVFNRMSNSISHGFGGIGTGLKNSLGYVGKFGSLFSSSSNKVTAGNNRMSRSNNTMVQSMRQLLPSLIVYQLLGGAIRALAGGLLSAMKTNDQFAASLNQIKVNLLTAFYPIYTAIMPAINALMSGLAQLTGQFASFIAGIFGTNYEAAKAGASGLYDNVQAMNDTGSSADKAKEKVKKFQKSLMGFDQINKLNLDSNDSDKDTSLDNKTPGIDFGSATGTYTTPKWMLDIQKILKDFFKPFQLAWRNQGQKVIDAWKYALNEVMGLAAAIGKSFMKVWSNGTGQRFVENLLILLADVLSIVGDIAGAFKRAWEDNGRGTRLIQSILNMWNSILELLHQVALAFRNAWNDDGMGERIAANILEIYTNIFETIGNLADQFKIAWQEGSVGESILKRLLGMFNGLLTNIKKMASATAEWAKKLDFSPLLKSIDKLLKSLQPLTKNLGDGLEWFYKNVLLPLGKYTIEDLIPAFLDTLSGAIDFLNGIVEGFKPAFKWLWDNFLKPVAEWSGGVIVSVLSGLGDALTVIGDWISQHAEGFSNFVLAFVSFVGAVKILGTIGTIVQVLSGIFTFLSGIGGLGGLLSVVGSALGGIVAVLGGPITIAIGLAVAAGVLLWKNWDKIKEVAGKLGKWIGEKWSDIKKATSETWGKVTEWTNKTWNEAKDKVVGKAREIASNVSEKWSSIKQNTSDKWNSVKENVISAATSAKNQASTAFSTLKTNMGKSFTKMKDTAKEVFGDIKGWASELGEKIGDGLSNGVEAVKTGAGKIFNGITGVLGKAVNGVIDGINWVLDRVGASKSKLEPWAVPKYARGTNYHPGGPALVNDGSGSNYREAFQTPDGQTGLFPAQRNLMVNLPKGTSVLSGPKTAQMYPAYAKGIGKWVLDGIGKTKEIISDVWSYAKKPAELIKTAITNKLSFSDALEPAFSMAAGTVSTLTEGAMSWLKKKFNKGFKKHQESANIDNFAAGSFAPHFGSPFVKTSDYGQRPGLFGDFHSGMDYAAAQGTPIPAQYNGTVDWIANSSVGLGKHVGLKIAKNLWALYGHMSEISVKMGQSVQRGQMVGRVGSTGWSTGPHVHYELRKGGPNGQHVNPLTYGNSAKRGSTSGGKGDIVDRAASYDGPVTNPAAVSFYTNENNAMEGGAFSALGTRLRLGDAAADPRFYRLGSYAWLNGEKFHLVDTGGAIKGKNRFDIFSGSSQARASSLGRQWWNLSKVGYENGGMIDRDGMYRLGEGNKKEMIIPLEKPNRAAELIQQAIEYLGLDMFNTTLTLPELFQDSTFTPSNSTFSNNDQMNYQGGGMQDFTSAMVTTLMNAISAMGATPTQAPNGDIIINIGGKEFGRIAVKEINKYHQQLGHTELNI